VLLTAIGTLYRHGTLRGTCKGTWYQYVDLRKIPEDKLTIEQRERLRDLKL
jgi:hypothetical protein